MTYIGPYTMASDMMPTDDSHRCCGDDAPRSDSIASILGQLKLKRPDYYYEGVVRSGLLQTKKYGDGEGNYTVFVPKHVPRDMTRQAAYTFCRATTVEGKLDPDTLASSDSMVLTTLDPARFIRLPQRIQEAVPCVNGWLYFLEH